VPTKRTSKVNKREFEQRWRDVHLDAFEEFRHSLDRERLRNDGLYTLGLTAQPTAEELFDRIGRMEDPEKVAAWLRFNERCGEVGAAYGLDARTTMMGSLARGYRPDAEGEKFFDLAATKARLEIVTDLDADLKSPFFTNLLSAAGALGLTVQTASGRFPPTRAGVTTRGDQVVGMVPSWGWVELTAEQRPPLAKAFRVRLELPPRFPPELATQWARRGVQSENALARMLGYRVPQKLRRKSIAYRD
jgi:hypothetical protein